MVKVLTTFLHVKGRLFKRGFALSGEVILEDLLALENMEASCPTDADLT